MFQSIDIYIYSQSIHLMHTLTGFRMLEKEGAIARPRYHFVKGKSPNLNYIEVKLDNRIWVGYDFRDGKSIYPALSAGNMDYYFKRSYRKECRENAGVNTRVFPLGFIYDVNTTGSAAAGFNPKSRIKDLLSGPFSVLWPGRMDFFRPGDFESLPDPKETPSAIFFARAWEPPISPSGQDMSFQRINDFRAECVRACRKAFGSRFSGGFEKSSYSDRVYPDVTIQDTNMTKRRTYLETMKKTDICIATTGLHESIGFKMGEYVAASRAIVSEGLLFQVTGGFEQGKNYLSFKTAEECVNRVEKLMLDKELRFNMMKNNWIYYNMFLRPDMSVLNSLITVYENEMKQ